MIIDLLAHDRDEADRIEAIKEAKKRAAGVDSTVTEAQTDPEIFAAVAEAVASGQMDASNYAEMIAAIQQQAEVEPGPEDDPAHFYALLGVAADPE